MVCVAYGIAIDSDIPLGLDEVRRAPDVTIRELAAPVEWNDVIWAEDDAERSWIGGRLGDDLILHFDDWADLVVAADGTSIGWHSFEGRSPTIVHLLLDHALPNLLMRRGLLVLHASCLVGPTGHAIAILGESGWGKSTLAAGLLERDYRFLSDDCAVIDTSDGRPRIAAGYPGLRLHEESLGLLELSDLVPGGEVMTDSAKVRLELGSRLAWSSTERFVLRTVFLIRPLDAATPTGPLQPIGPVDALLTVLRHSFHFGEGDERSALLDRAAVVAESCPGFELPYRRTTAGLDATLHLVDEIAAAPRQPAPTTDHTPDTDR
ncbi:MAG: hypothetical protein ACR2QO_23500 [Acidimicrobiales bacterium]